MLNKLQKKPTKNRAVFAINDAPALLLNQQGELLNLTTGETLYSSMIKESSSRQGATLAFDATSNALPNASTNAELMALLKTVEVIWVPSQLVMAHRVFVPGKRAADCQKALPFVLEAELSKPIEDYSIQIIHREKATSAANGTVFTVLLVAHSQMQIWQQTMSALKLNSASLLPDYLRLQAQSLCCQHETGSCLIRLDETYGFSAPQAFAEAWFGLALQKLASLPNSSEVEDPFADLSWSSIAATPAVNLLDSALTGLEASKKWQLKKYHLLQGAYALQQSRGIWQQGLANTLWLGAGLFVIGLLHMNWQITQTAQQTQIYQTQTQALFKEMFPDVKRVVNIKAQTISRLKTKAVANQEVNLLEWLSVVERLMIAVPEVKAGKLKWNNQKQILNLQLEASNQQALQRLNQLASQRFAQYKIEVRTKRVQAQQVEAELNVSQP